MNGLTERGWKGVLGQAEYAVIGSVIIDPRLAPDMRARLRAEDFITPEGKQFYEYVSKGGVLDAVAIESNLGNSEFFGECVKITPTATHFDAYADILIEESQKRKLEDIALALSGATYDGRETKEIIAELSQQLNDMNSLRRSAVKTSCEIEEEWITHYDKAKINPDEGRCKSGYGYLDTILGNGFIDSGLYIIGARPGMGKTTFALNIADRITKRNNAVLFVSLEMSAKQIMAKRIAAASQTSYSGLLNGQLEGEEERRAMLMAVDLAKRPFYMLENASATVADIESAARQIPDIKCVIVDYLGLVRSAHPNKMLYEQVSEVSRDMKTLAMNLDVPVLALCQLNRDGAKGGDGRPKLTDLRDSGAIEQDADGVLLLYRADYFEKTDKPNQMEVIVAKNRHGSVNCSANFGWRAESGSITEVEPNEKTPWEEDN